MKKLRGFEYVIDDMKRTDGTPTLPTRATDKAAAYDLYSNAKYSVKPGKIAKIWTDVKAYMQDDEVLVLNVRSSMGGKWMLANTQGWIDADYYSNEGNDGCIGVFLKNISDEELVIERGDRIAQAMFLNYLITDNDVANGKRNGGFGSTGK